VVYFLLYLLFELAKIEDQAHSAILLGMINDGDNIQRNHITKEPQFNTTNSFLLLGLSHDVMAQDMGDNNLESHLL
jgi:hypothetical protein